MIAFLSTLLGNPTVLAGILGLLGTLAGWAVKLWLSGQAEKEAIAKQQAAEQQLATSLESQAQTHAGEINQSIEMQNQAATQWFETGSVKPPEDTTKH